MNTNKNTGLGETSERKNDPKVAKSGDINPKMGGDKPYPSESICQKCNGVNPAWSANNELWNKIVRHPDGKEASEKYSFLCPNCFIQLAESLGIRITWHLTAQQQIKEQLKRIVDEACEEDTTGDDISKIKNAVSRQLKSQGGKDNE